MIHIGEALKARTVTLAKTSKTERGELLAYFAEELGRNIRFIGVRCAHYSTSDLYALQSAYKDRLARNTKEKAHIYFWALTKTKTTPTG